MLAWGSAKYVVKLHGTQDRSATWGRIHTDNNSEGLDHPRKGTNSTTDAYDRNLLYPPPPLQYHFSEEA